MKQAVTLLLLAALLAVASCSRTPAPTGAGGAPTPVVMPSEQAGLATAGPERTPQEEYETAQPMPTPWPEPATVDYGGSYSDVALDRNPGLYPALKLTANAIETSWGPLRLPEGWTVDDAEGSAPVILDGGRRAVGVIAQVISVPSEPYFSFKNEDDILIAWEAPEYALPARILTVETPPSTDLNGGKAIVRTVCLITEGPYSDDESAYYLAICLSLDKAYVSVDGKIDYVISNAMIDEIAKSLAESLS